MRGDKESVRSDMDRFRKKKRSLNTKSNNANGGSSKSNPKQFKGILMVDPSERKQSTSKQRKKSVCFINISEYNEEEEEAIINNNRKKYKKDRKYLTFAGAIQLQKVMKPFQKI